MLLSILEGGGPFGDSLPAPAGTGEEDYQKLVLAAEDAHRSDREAWEAARRDTEDYYATWVHQIKAPIAVMRILLQQAEVRAVPDRAVCGDGAVLCASRRERIRSCHTGA